MSLKLYMHPLSSFCHKVLIALYENNTPFEPKIVDLGDEAQRNAFRKITPFARFPLLRDERRDQTIPESSIIIEYLAHHYQGKTKLIPEGADLARQTRQSDRFYDLYVSVPVQKIVTDRIRPAGAGDAFGVEQARALLTTSYDVIEREMVTKTWAMGNDFTMADCAAAPALFYANKVLPFDTKYRVVAAYYERLCQRPSFARVLDEAQPYLAMFPQ